MSRLCIAGARALLEGEYHPMNRKEIAQQTLQIQKQGYYEYNDQTIDIAGRQKAAEQNSFLLTPEQGQSLLAQKIPPPSGALATCRVANQSTVQAVVDMAGAGHSPAVLNFASAKNPGGGFLNGAMAQEEALAAASGLYRTLVQHPEYYAYNRAHHTMMYSDHAIYSPDVPFFRDGSFALLQKPVAASVLTLPAVNMGQVLQKGEDVQRAKVVMKDRMRLCLAIFAEQGATHLILGAYGCGVFRNDAADVAGWWRQLLQEEGYGRFFSQIVFAVLSKNSKNIGEFEAVFGDS